MRPIINSQFTTCQPRVAGRYFYSVYNQSMVDDDTFAKRFKRLRGERSFQVLSEDILAKMKVRITAQALHKWEVKNGGITVENAQIIADFFGVRPGWLLFGEGNERLLTLDDMIVNLPNDHPEAALDFLEYRVDKAKPFMANEVSSAYVAKLKSIRARLPKKPPGRPI